jgi:hypothetical protein
MAMPVGADGFLVTLGDTITSERLSPKGSRSVHHHCPLCLVRTHTLSDARLGLVTVRPGTLDDTTWLVPAMQLWTRSAMPWALAGDVPCLLEDADDYGPYRSRWRESCTFVRLQE